MWSSFPAFGTALLLGVMILASYTFAVSLSAGASGRMRALQAARLGAYGTVAMIAVCVFCLAYAFVSHDFRLRYVSHYSDRSMPVYYLLTALWGGQDGSLLWWLFLLSIYIGACVKWLGNRWVALQPYVIATLMAIVMFFVVLMTFAANPFSTSVAGARPDGEGLNPLLQNFYMIIHPPSLYTGFVGCSVPFAFAVAALVTGRLDSEWIVASRKWTLFAWLFLAIGNTLGMLWAYEELGWGGYWAWDPVENAAFMPFLTASAFVHSVMIQERRGLLKVWNVFLIIMTFFMTIFGTFLTRSGAIASVHSFAQSGIGTYFVYFLCVLFVFGLSLVLWRWPELRSLTPTRQLRWAALAAGWTAVSISGPGVWITTSKLPWPPAVKVLLGAFIIGAAVYAAVEIVYRKMTADLELDDVRPRMESVWSREFTFLLNNWALLGFLFFVLVATTFPMLSEALWDEKVTVGPPYYNAWVQPIGFVIYALMGIGTLFGWKKTSPQLLRRAYRWPLGVTAAAVIGHFAIGKSVGHPAVVWGDAIYGGVLGSGLRAFNAITPVLGIALVAFNLTVIVQEFVALFRARAKTGAEKTPSILYWLGGLPGLLFTLVTLPPPSRRRYGGYVVHFGLIMMLFGFTGRSWNIDKETSMSPGNTYDIGSYHLQYVGPRMEVDTTKRMVFADVHVTRSGKDYGTVSPAKFIYKKSAESPTTEVAMLHTLWDDLYVVVGQINPQTKLATFQLHVNPLVSWIWFGCMVLILGAIVCMWPELQPEESRVWAIARTAAATAASVTIGIVIAMLPAPALAQGSSSMSGTVEVHSDRERALFNATRCMCGGCERLPLTSCACPEADEARHLIREKIAAGWSNEDILAWYLKEHGSDSLTVPPNRGGMQLIYAVPVVALIGGGVGVLLLARKWNKRAAPVEKKVAAGKKRDAYDERLDAELRDLDD
jgi:cytochrome c-type biogenesis protein CcmF